MYRIRLSSGEEAVYRTVEELAQAVSSGVVSAHAEVFHKAGNRWLPINTHPDYRALVTAKRPAPAEPPSSTPATQLDQAITPPTSRPAIEEPTRERSEEAVPAPEFIESVQVPEEAPADPITANPFAPRSLRPGKRRLFLIAVMGLLGLAAGVGAVVLPSWTRQPKADASPRSQWDGMPAPGDSIRVPSAESLQPPPSPELATAAAPAAAAPPPAGPDPAPGLAPSAPRPDTFAVHYPAPSKPLAPLANPGTAGPARAAAPRVSRMTGTVSRLPSYFEAYADARAEMDEGLDYVSFHRVFAPSRFSAPDSLRSARRMVQAAGNILRVYRSREVMLEQTYRPGNPDSRGSLRETFEASEASRSLLSDVDSLFGLLVGQQGEFVVRADGIAFQSRSAAREYAQLRHEILQAITAWRDSAEAPSLVTMPRLLRAIDTSLPPPPR